MIILNKDKLVVYIFNEIFQHLHQSQSKGGILAKTCEYIADLQSTNQRFSESVAKLERVQLDYEVARLEVCLKLIKNEMFGSFEY